MYSLFLACLVCVATVPCVIGEVETTCSETDLSCTAGGNSLLATKKQLSAQKTLVKQGVSESNKEDVDDEEDESGRQECTIEADCATAIKDGVNKPFCCAKGGKSVCYKSQCKGGRSDVSCTDDADCMCGRSCQGGKCRGSFDSFTEANGPGCSSAASAALLDDSGKAKEQSTVTKSGVMHEAERSKETCALGQFTNSDGECEDCSPGKFSDDASGSSQECLSCEPGKFASAPGLTECSECGEGSMPNSEATECIADPDYSPVECTDTDGSKVDSYGDNCAAYTEFPDFCKTADDEDFVSEDLCCACGGGSKETEDDNSHVIAAAAAAAAAAAGSSTAPLSADCTLGQFTNSDGQCEDCSPGKFSADPSGLSASCSACDAGKFAAGQKMTECLDCGKGLMPNSDATECVEDPDYTPVECTDTNGESKDAYEGGCDEYSEFPDFCDYPGNDEDFTAEAMCCACGGGSGSS